MEISVLADISAHEWPIYRYRPQKSHISRSLIPSTLKIYQIFLISYIYTSWQYWLPVAPDGVLTYGKSKFALIYSNGKAIPSGFSHFYCHRVVLSTQKNFKGFFNISGRLGESNSWKYRQRPARSTLAARPKSRPLAARAISTMVDRGFSISNTLRKLMIRA